MSYKPQKSFLEKVIDVKESTWVQAWNQAHQEIREQEWWARERESLKQEIIAEVMSRISIEITNEASPVIQKLKNDLNSLGGN